MPLIDVTPIIRVIDQLMIDRCRIDRETAETGFNPVTGRYDPNGYAIVYNGQCMVAALKTVRPTTVQAIEGGALSVDVSLWLTLPLAFRGELNPKDVATITASNNPNLVGQRFTMREDAETGTYSVSRRFLLHKFIRVPSDG